MCVGQGKCPRARVQVWLRVGVQVRSRACLPRRWCARPARDYMTLVNPGVGHVCVRAGSPCMSVRGGCSRVWAYVRCALRVCLRVAVLVGYGPALPGQAWKTGPEDGKKCIDIDFLSGPVAQWIRHRPTEPGIAGSSPAGVICRLSRPLSMTRLQDSSIAKVKKTPAPGTGDCSFESRRGPAARLQQLSVCPSGG